VARLLEYEQFQQVAEQLRTMASEAGRAFPRPIAEQWEGAVPLVELRPADLLEALRRMTGDEATANGNGTGRAPSLRVRRHAVNLRQRIVEVLRRVEANEGPLPFSSLVVRAGKRLGRQEVLVTFLAVLELVRQGLVTAWQRGAPGEILLLPKAAEVETSAGEDER
jgi:segregation and condensation protein A